MKRRLLTLVALMIAVILVVAACAPGNGQAPAQDPAPAPPAAADPAPADEPADAPADPGADQQVFLFGYTSMTQLNPFFVILESSMREVIEEAGHQMITMNPAMDQELQINQIEDLIVQGIDLMFLNAVDWEGIAPSLFALTNAGIPIVNFDAEVYDIHMVDIFVGSDNFNAGYVVGVDLVERLPEGGPIAILDAPAFASVRDRVDGFMAAIEGHPFDVVFQMNAFGDLEVAQGIAEDLLIAHPNVVAIFGGNDPSALGAYAAVLAAGRDDIFIYGVDGSPDAKAAMAAGGPFVGSGAQSPISIGRLSAEYAIRIMAGESVPDRVPVPTFIINQENVHDFGVEGWQ